MSLFIYFFPQIHFGCHDNQWSCGILTKSICLAEDHSINISDLFGQNICKEIARNANFHYSPLQVNRNFTLPLQRKHMSNCNKNTILIEANAMNISTKFQLHPPCGFWGDDFSPQIKHFGCQGNQSNSEVCTKIICLVEDYSINISEELLPKYLQRDNNKWKFTFFPLQVNGNFNLP